LYAATGEERFAAAAAGAATATYQARWQSLPSACHGLAGNGQFLLDAAAVLNEPKYAGWARDFADLLAIRIARIEGRYLGADGPGWVIVGAYKIGLAGVLDFLHRLEVGGPRPWMLEQVVR